MQPIKVRPHVNFKGRHFIMVDRINHDLISFIHQIPLKLGITRYGVMFNNFDITPQTFPIHQN